MSLYSGIKFSDPEGARLAQEQAERDAALAKTASSSGEAVAADNAAAGEQGTATALAEGATAEKPGPASSSAALKFAPVIRKKPLAQQRTTSVFGSAPASAIAALAKPTVVARPTTALAPIASTSTSTSLGSDSALTAERKIKPPPLTLDEEDVNGFKQTSAGKKAAQRNNKKKRKRNNNANKRGEDPQLAFTNIPYDPARPCDYLAYKTHVEVKRAERMRKHSSESEYDSSDSGRSDTDERVLKRERLFAPPASYDAPTSDDHGVAAHAVPAPSERAAAMTQETAEEAYQRRVAMSQRQQEAGEDAYQRRMALSQAQARPVAQSAQSTNPPLPPPPLSSSSSQPRPAGPMFVAAATPASAPVMSSPAPSAQPAQPSAAAQPALSEAAQRAREIAARLTKMGGAKPPINTALMPNPEKPDFVPPPATVITNLASAPAHEEQSLDDVFDSLEKEDESSKPDNRPFAQRIMSQWGYETGKGLGKDESGMTRALRMETAAQQAKKKGNAPPQGDPAANLKGRGTIVDSTRKDRLAGERDKYGEPSRVVLLTNMCGLEDIDDDLPGEVAEEASRFGLVERVFVYAVPHEERPDEKVRIFLLMSGLAGGYNAVKTFDQRFFAGRTVRARYYDEKMFTIARYDL